MREPTLVFTQDREGDPELIVNFGVFSGREATDAEVDRLAQVLLEEVDSVEIVCERRHEFDGGSEAKVYVVRVDLPDDAESRLGHFSTLVEGWATDCIAERRHIAP
jgi:hypothetical protein